MILFRPLFSNSLETVGFFSLIPQPLSSSRKTFGVYSLSRQRVDVFRELINYNLIHYFHRRQNVHKRDNDYVILLFIRKYSSCQLRTWLLSVNIYLCSENTRSFPTYKFIKLILQFCYHHRPVNLTSCAA